MVEMAITQLTQLDIRRRQVAVNVRIIDVNLAGGQNQNASFSFGVGNNFFVSDGGAASLNFGGSRPATNTEARTSVTDTPVINNPITGTPFLRDNFFNPPSGRRPLASPPLDPDGNPLQPGITDFDPGDETSPPEYTYNLPSLYQFPKRLLATLQAQVISGNAKILTDPTLIVQEGQEANLKLTQEVVGNIESKVTRGDGTSTQTVTAEKTDVGLSLAVKVERIDDNGFVSLSVAPIVKAPQSSAVINVGDNSQTIFLVSERSLRSGVVRLRDGQTLILSGIIQDQDRTTVSKLPILGDLPLIGSLFRRTERTNERREVIVLLTPQVMDDSENSAYGYNYTPSPQVRQILERRGLNTPRR
jgi:type IV pilus assembly protein PilQ